VRVSYVLLVAVLVGICFVCWMIGESGRGVVEEEDGLVFAAAMAGDGAWECVGCGVAAGVER